MIAPFRAPVGLWNRVVVMWGTFSIVLTLWPFPHSWRYVLFYLMVWVVIYWMSLSNAYYRGGRDAFRSLGATAEGMEMYANTKLVALQDLRRLCNEYDISLEEIKPIIERGFGVQIVEVIDADGDDSD